MKFKNCSVSITGNGEAFESFSKFWVGGLDGLVIQGKQLDGKCNLEIILPSNRPEKDKDGGFRNNEVVHICPVEKSVVSYLGINKLDQAKYEIIYEDNGIHIRDASPENPYRGLILAVSPRL